MKQLYTSYYAKSGHLSTAISISLSSPSFFRRRWYPLLAPSYPILKAYKKGKINEEEYELLYIDLLETDRSLTPQKVLDDLPDQSVLLCYEKTGKFCHRHIVAEWLKQCPNVIITEIIDPKPLHIVDELFTF